MNVIDCYRVLGIPINSDEDEVRKAYRRLAMQYHPDRNKDNPEAERRFKEVATAYEVLRNQNGTKDTSDGDDIFTAFCGLFVGFYEGFFGAIER